MTVEELEQWNKQIDEADDTDLARIAARLLLQATDRLDEIRDAVGDMADRLDALERRDR